MFMNEQEPVAYVRIEMAAPALADEANRFRVGHAYLADVVQRI